MTTLELVDVIRRCRQCGEWKSISAYDSRLVFGRGLAKVCDPCRQSQRSSRKRAVARSIVLIRDAAS